MLSKIHSTSILGIEAHSVIIEVDCTGGLPGYCMVGLPDSAVKESRERVFSALKNSGYVIPNQRITINLAPADMKKAGSLFDLPIAIGVLIASQQIEAFNLENTVIIGELSLDGTVKSVKGILSTAVYSKETNCRGLILPEINYQEASVISGLKIYPVRNLEHVISVIENPEENEGALESIDYPDLQPNWNDLDFSDVKGQEQAKRACEIAASGAHNFLFIGSPGCGKSLMSKRIPTILPQMTEAESLKTTMIYSSAGLLSRGAGIMKNRPFRAPHHTISNMALVGGGTYPKPGEVSLAHNGVLFLDELPEFQKPVLEALRQPLEDGAVTISRTSMTLTFPCQSMMGAAMNPCPCGYMLDPKKRCICEPNDIKKYLSRISGPLMDRIDIQLEMPVLSFDEMSKKEVGESSEQIRNRVEASRLIQQHRFRESENIYCNAHMGTRDIRKYCELNDSAKKLFREVVENLGISARAYDRILRVSRTIADLGKSESIKDEHLAEAVHYRSLDRTSRYLG